MNLYKKTSEPGMVSHIISEFGSLEARTAAKFEANVGYIVGSSQAGLYIYNKILGSGVEGHMGHDHDT